MRSGTPGAAPGGTPSGSWGSAGPPLYRSDGSGPPRRLWPRPHGQVAQGSVHQRPPADGGLPGSDHARDACRRPGAECAGDQGAPPSGSWGSAQDRSGRATGRAPRVSSQERYDATTQPLCCTDVELVAETGKIAPEVTPRWAGSPVSIPVNAPGRTGRHVVFMIWQASHLDQSFYSCGDVIFPGG
ncbi:lytic polysaccharide monooxygenase [Streptomyces milbemycinicus]|uniref:lytic polysaccharide monooxygenase n=1 Tax=Streptomyces milbemycinicus TaxID=476552 RepID=UPI0033FA69BF